MKTLTGIILLLLITMSCKTTEAPTTSASLLGVVYDYKNNPVQGATLEFSNKVHTTVVTTDIDGKYLIPELDFGYYQIIISSSMAKTTETGVDHMDPENVLISRIYSYNDLLDRFKVLLKDEDYNQIPQIIKEIDEIDSGDLYYLFLKGNYLYKTRKYKDAESLLLTLLRETNGDIYVHLLLADIYQYGLENTQLAIKYLQKFLDSEYSERETIRLKELLREESM